MKRRGPLLETLTLRGLTVAPAQSWGQVRLAPLIRAEARGDLRLTRRDYDKPLTVVQRSGEPLEPGTKYISYIPHGLVMRWTDGGEPVAALGSQLLEERVGRPRHAHPHTVQVLSRMTRREGRDRLRLLPQHLAIEGLLAMHFQGPDTAWSDWSREALRTGLSPRSERAITGRAIAGLQEALGLFEIHPGQCGVVLYVADVLAAAFVVPHAEDYRALHETLLLDLYGESLYHYGRLRGALPDLSIPPELPEKATTLADLRAALAQSRADWAALHAGMASGLLGRPVASERVYEAGPFRVERFLTVLDPTQENHLGEAILRADGTLEYLKTFRLSAQQVASAMLLERCAAHGWRLEHVAEAMHMDKDALVRRMCRMGFGYLLKKETVRHAYAGAIPGWVRPG